MRFKYFLRGLGTGIVFAAIIFLSAYRGADRNSISDEEIIRRAKDLGMVEKNDPIGDLLTSENNTTENITTEAVTTEAPKKEKVTTEKATTENKDKTTEKATTEEKTTEAKTTEEATTESDTKKEGETVKLTINRGDSSFPVCQRLKDLGVIDNAEEFDDYLIEHGYANRLRVGEHPLKIGMDYHSIAEAISDPV